MRAFICLCHMFTNGFSDGNNFYCTSTVMMWAPETSVRGSVIGDGQQQRLELCYILCFTSNYIWQVSFNFEGPYFLSIPQMQPLDWSIVMYTLACVEEWAWVSAMCMAVWFCLSLTHRFTTQPSISEIVLLCSHTEKYRNWQFSTQANLLFTTFLCSFQPQQVTVIT